MSGTENVAAREDAVLWQWPKGAREWLRAGCWVWRSRSMLLMAVVLGIYLGGFLLVFSGAIMVLGGADFAVLAASALLIVILIGVPAIMLTGFGCLMVSRLTIARDEVRLASRIPWRRVEAVARSDIRSVEIHEGDGAIALYGDAGEMLSASHVAKSADFAAVLDMPTLAWPRHRSSKVADLLLLLSCVAWSVLTIVAMMAVSLSAHRLYEIAIGPIPQQGLHFSVIIFVYVAGMIIATPLTLSLVTIIGRFFVPRSSLAEFILFLLHNKRWHGDTPARRSLIDRFLSASIRLATSVARIPLPPPLKPELRHGMTPEMAAEALATAERAG